VISKPQMLTMDNVKAQLSVGQTIPLISQTIVAGVTTQQSSGRQEVSLKMDLTPHLNDSDSVRLEIDGEISDVPEGTSVGPGGALTNKRVLKTAVVVKDGETVVLGGLQKETMTDTVSKIPFIGDIPVLGRLFQTRTKQRVKQDLLILLTPHVIRSSDDLRRIYQQREDERREFLERSGAFKDESVYSAHVDYRRKRGLLEEINVVARQAEVEAAAVRAAEKVLKAPPPEGLVN
jgi:general secretion pathway protein D